jgi:hypothetical protein
MSLYGSIKEVQNTTEKFYLKLEQRFRGNKLIAHLWSQMAQDVSRQIVSLHDLPKSFWTHLKKDQQTLPKTIQTEVSPQNIENTSELSLSDCIGNAIRSEEAIILKIYVPIIRNLRKNWTGQALDFYIMVKAHTVRIKRVAEAFSGDPEVLQHASLLFQKFEKEIQEPDVEVILKKRSARRSGGSRVKKAKKSQQKPNTKVKLKTASKAKSAPKIKAKLKEAASKAKAAPKTKVKAKAASKAKAAPKTKVKAKAASKAKAAPKTKVKAKAASKAKPAPKTKVKAKAASKAKSAPKRKVKPKAASKPKSVPKTKVKPKAASKPKNVPKKSKKKSQSLTGHSKMRRSRSKRLVKKTNLRRGRARR